ncbi:unnamed protein product [Lupinus luteus]|uniref:Uncharacterized protein n=1 Tax=Lupinus luteus TaxID=3873 RepID=A0AAV1YA69_LUPLU
MGKVYPQQSTSSSCLNSKRETYTLWMKSLVFHSNGCTVYDSNGAIVYRKSLSFGSWDGYRRNSSNCGSMEEPWFQVKRCNKMMRRKVECEIEIECQKYCILRTSAKAAFRIVNIDGHIVAEAKQKYSGSGVALDNDVLTLDVAEDVDHSLVMALVTVYGLICGRM